ncbi:MAG: aminomethyl transferase family protein [Caldilineaceae bacterium]|nr:aminomethyl transferase family protein [Caldilineaceae bacterium]
MQENLIQTIDPAAYAALIDGAARLSRPDACVLRLTDADRSDFLHRMTTNNINVLRPGQSAVTALTSPTARILYVFTVVCRADELILLPAPGQSAALARHLRGQIFFMDKVKVTDLSDEWARLRLLGPKASTLLAHMGFDAGVDTGAPQANTVLEQGDLLAVAQPQYEVPGYEVVLPAARQAEALAALEAAGAQPVDAATYEARRIELGRPAAGAELTEDYNPLEAGLAWACAEDKGCYTGQEIIARQITYDKVTRTLVGLLAAQPLTPGAEVMVDGRSLGQITSAAHSPALDAPIALAVIKRPANTPGTQVTVTVTDGSAAAQVVSLPFVTEPA